MEPHTVFGLSELPPPAGRVRAIRVRLASGLSRWPSGPSGRATPCPGPVGLVFESQRASDAPEGQHPDPRSGRSACSLPRISFKTPCLLGLMRMPCAQDPTRTPVRRGPCISAPPRDPPAEAATSLADAGPRDRAAPAKFNTTQTASMSVASRVPYLQYATRRSPRQGVGNDPRDPARPPPRLRRSPAAMPTPRISAERRAQPSADSPESAEQRSGGGPGHLRARFASGTPDVRRRPTHDQLVLRGGSVARPSRPTRLTKPFAPLPPSNAVRFASRTGPTFLPPCVRFSGLPQGRGERVGMRVRRARLRCTPACACVCTPPQPERDFWQQHWRPHHHSPRLAQHMAAAGPKNARPGAARCTALPGTANSLRSCAQRRRDRWRLGPWLPPACTRDAHNRRAAHAQRNLSSSRGTPPSR